MFASPLWLRLARALAVLLVVLWMAQGVLAQDEEEDAPAEDPAAQARTLGSMLRNATRTCDRNVTISAAALRTNNGMPPSIAQHAI